MAKTPKSKLRPSHFEKEGTPSFYREKTLSKCKERKRDNSKNSPIVSIKRNKLDSKDGPTHKVSNIEIINDFANSTFESKFSFIFFMSY